MPHPADTNYIIEVISDDWDRPESFNGQRNEDQSGTYRMIDNRTGGTASSYGYVTSHSFPSWVTSVCPNAPDCTYEEASALVSTEGPSGSAWSPLLGY